MIIHPLLKLAVSQPQMLGDHLQAYAALAAEEMKKVSAALSVRIGMYAAAALLFVIGVIWTGVALLLVATIPPEQYRAAWALWAVPLTPVVIAVVLLLVVRAMPAEQPFEVLKRELKADMDVIREAGEQ